MELNSPILADIYTYKFWLDKPQISVAWSAKELISSFRADLHISVLPGQAPELFL
jgi:hypothetical protein